MSMTRVGTVLCVVAVCLASAWAGHFLIAQGGGGGQLSPEARIAIADKLQSSGSKMVYELSDNGQVRKSSSLDEKMLAQYQNITDYLGSKDSPVSCTQPITPVPPPGCVSCGKGNIVCGNALKAISSGGRGPMLVTPSQ